MITVRPGSHAHDIITLLSFVGEFPVRSLYLLGNERVIKALVHRMTLLQEYRLPEGAELDLHDLKKGIYLLSARGRQHSWTQKIQRL